MAEGLGQVVSLMNAYDDVFADDVRFRGTYVPLLRASF
jgi:hypothetical protein